MVRELEDKGGMYFFEMVILYFVGRVKLNEVLDFVFIWCELKGIIEGW